MPLAFTATMRVIPSASNTLVPTAPVSSGGTATPGAVAVMNLTSISLTATVPVPAARYVVESHNGTRLLAFGEGSNVVTVIAPTSIGTADDPRTPVCCFDHPSWAIFSSDDSKAYILECGPECGGTTAGISVLDLTANPVSVTTKLPLAGAGATIGLLNGSTLYVAGTPPGTITRNGRKRLPPTRRPIVTTRLPMAASCSSV